MKVTKCVGEGQGSCKRCSDNGKWNRNWMCFLYEIEGYEMDDIRYLPDFYLPEYDRWFEIKGKPMSIAEIKKCEEFCFRKDNENINMLIDIHLNKLLFQPL